MLLSLAWWSVFAVKLPTERIAAVRLQFTVWSFRPFRLGKEVWPVVLGSRRLVIRAVTEIKSDWLAIEAYAGGVVSIEWEVSTCLATANTASSALVLGSWLAGSCSRCWPWLWWWAHSWFDRSRGRFGSAFGRVAASPPVYSVDALCHWSSMATSSLISTDQRCLVEIRGFAAAKIWKLTNFFGIVELRRLRWIAASLPPG